ncbi:MAG TPA: hypothetical protein VL404_03210, partial [Candidatus Eisenbacteria bacterium]|nr:hypothetical protein [Candidatus Eisenbacteria bacterium]
GSSVINSSQLFSSPKMSEFIRLSRSRYDLVLYDTPPLTIISDTAILLSQISASLLTVRSGVTNARVLPKVFSVVQDSKTDFIGVVLNSIESSDNPYYNKYYQRK